MLHPHDMLYTVVIIFYCLLSFLSNEDDKKKAEDAFDQILNQEGCFDNETCQKILLDFNKCLISNMVSVLVACV